MSIENAIQSLHFGRHFWLDEDKELCSCPTFTDGTPDEDNWDYVSEWHSPSSYYPRCSKLL